MLNCTRKHPGGDFTAILKHIASKNDDYGKAQRYLMFQHNEYTGKPILDESGRMIPREEFYLDGLNCDPFTFDTECMELNNRYNKNNSFNEIKSHHYIISFDPKDVSENGLTGEKAQQLGLDFARKNFSGHQALVCTHTDGHNKSGNIHVHIVINSLRKFDEERQSFMQFPCEYRAGCKHHLSRECLIHLKKSVMELCEHENLHQADLLTPAKRKIAEKEYHAKRSGQKKMNKQNQEMIAGGITPRKTVFQTQKDDLRAAIDEAAAVCRNLEEFQNYLLEKYRITLKISRGRFSYLHPERQKPVTGRKLGTNYEKEYLIKRLEENAKSEIGDNKRGEPSASMPAPLRASQPDLDNAFAFVRTDLRLVLDLQKCIKAQQNRAYARRVKLSNLQQMAKTVSYVQEHGYDTRQALVSAFENAQAQTGEMRTALRSTEQTLKEINEQIHYTGQYLAGRKIYGQYLRSGNKKRFRQEHQAEITLYETARKFLRERYGTNRFPDIKSLKEEKDRLSRLRDSQYAAYQNLRNYLNELKTVCTNVDMILDGGHARQPEQMKNQDIS